MTPRVLLKDLSRELHHMFDQTSYGANGDGKVQIFEEVLPQLQDGQVEKEVFPYILIQLVSGKIVSLDSPYAVMVKLKIGAYDDAKEEIGYEMVLNIIHHIYERFAKDNLLNDCFRAENSFQWEILEEESVQPYFIGQVELIFDLPKLCRENGLI